MVLKCVLGCLLLSLLPVWLCRIKHLTEPLEEVPPNAAEEVPTNDPA